MTDRGRNRVLRLEATGEVLAMANDPFFAATGITDGELVNGVRYNSRGAHTSSLVMRSLSGTVRRIESEHHLDRLNLLTQFYD